MEKVKRVQKIEPILEASLRNVEIERKLTPERKYIARKYLGRYNCGYLQERHAIAKVIGNASRQ